MTTQPKIPGLQPGRATTKIPAPSEASQQEALFEMARRFEGRYPALKWLHHCPNGGGRFKAEAAALKRRGVKPGVPDIKLDWHKTFQGRKCAGIAGEMKRPGKRVSQDQLFWRSHLISQGYQYGVWCLWLEAWRDICAYLEIPLNEDGMPLP